MNCTYCGSGMGGGSNVCPNCGAGRGKVQVLTPGERENFEGLTIENGPGQPDGRFCEYKSANGRRRVYVHQVNLGKSTPGLFAPLLTGAVILGLAVLLLPLALLMVGILLSGWLMAGFLRRR
ncbi:MAG: hypothetical protein K6U80_12435 [Firmicutes bacterium]|nr:hypothetical protein [Bacillota bacterium]